MRKISFLVVATLALFCAKWAFASVASPGYVLGFVTVGNNIVLVYTDGSRMTPPSCSNPNFPQRWAFDVTTAIGQATLSILMSAHAMQERVTIYGTGACTVLGDSETIAGIVTNTLQ